MNRSSTRFRRLMLLLGDPSRYALARALDAGGKCVTDLAGEIGLSQSCTTRHLQALERERVVRGSRAGKRVIYALRRDDSVVMELLAMAGRPGRSQDAHLVYTDSPMAEVTQDATLEDPGKSRSEPATPDPPEPGLNRRSDIEDYLL